MPSLNPINYIKEAYRVFKSDKNTNIDPRKSNAIFGAYTLLYFIGDQFNKNTNKGYEQIQKLR